MRILLDTHTLIWHAAQSSELGETARRIIASPDNEIVVSVASFWEMAIKAGLGKLKVDRPLSDYHLAYKRMNATILPVLMEHSLAVEKLPLHHRDPFDRLLIAQGITEELLLLSRDAVFDRYPVTRIW